MTTPTSIPPQHRQPHNMNQSPPPPPPVETALQWFQRCQRALIQEREHTTTSPQDPASAALSFLRGNSGIAYVDEAWKRISRQRLLSPAGMSQTNSHSSQSSSRHFHQQQHNSSVVVLEGSVGKTWTLLSLAARYVVATRASRFANENSDDNNPFPMTMDEEDVSQQPQVILLDSSFDITPRILRHVVRSTLLRQQSNISEDMVDLELQFCLQRIHVITVDTISDWVPVLELLQYSIRDQKSLPHPTLLLWDGLLSANSSRTTTSNSTAANKEVDRQLVRLLHHCQEKVAVVLTKTCSSHQKRSQYRSPSWECERQAQKVVLERRNGKDCVATIHNKRLPFSLSLAGILS